MAESPNTRTREELHLIIAFTIQVGRTAHKSVSSVGSVALQADALGLHPLRVVRPNNQIRCLQPSRIRIVVRKVDPDIVRVQN
jgi:hypothetical protein